MSCLFYCVCRHPGSELSGSLLGVGGRPVYQVAHRGLSVALSQIGPADLDPDIPRVRAYERVVLSYHRRGAVVPMRYGCVVEQESQAIQLLEEHGPRYETLLQELDGCVEMGLRVLLPSGPWAAVIPGGPEASREVAGPCPPDPAAAAGLLRVGLPHGPPGPLCQPGPVDHGVSPGRGALPGAVHRTVRQVHHGSSFAPAAPALPVFPGAAPGGGVFSPGFPATHRERVGPAAAERSLATL